MAVEKTADGSIIITGDDIERSRWLRVRMALYLEIRTGMVRSNRGRPSRVLANEITGIESKSKKVAYEELNRFIVTNMGDEFDKPLP